MVVDVVRMGNVRTHLRKLEQEGRIRVYAGKPKTRPAEETAKAVEEEHERLAIIQKAEELKEQARRRALAAQESPALEEWEEMPRFQLAGR